MLLLSPFYKWRIWGTEWRSHLLKVTQLRGGRDKTLAQAHAFTLSSIHSVFLFLIHFFFFLVGLFVFITFWCLSTHFYPFLLLSSIPWAFVWRTPDCFFTCFKAESFWGSPSISWLLPSCFSNSWSSFAQLLASFEGRSSCSADLVWKDCLGSASKLRVVSQLGLGSPSRLFSLILSPGYDWALGQ